MQFTKGNLGCLALDCPYETQTPAQHTLLGSRLWEIPWPVLHRCRTNIVRVPADSTVSLIQMFPFVLSASLFHVTLHCILTAFSPWLLLPAGKSSLVCQGCGAMSMWDEVLSVVEFPCVLHWGQGPWSFSPCHRAGTEGEMRLVQPW